MKKHSRIHEWSEADAIVDSEMFNHHGNCPPELLDKNILGLDRKGWLLKFSCLRAFSGPKDSIWLACMDVNSNGDEDDGDETKEYDGVD
ncbi:hypothetical protein RJ641_022564 [Dillenia turbinata]|uniref:Uncharacterized protein n=1 Tax=Dillenia turbinata TaxID=194707 RepID=A0AAN8YX94_9MAGN